MCLSLLSQRRVHRGVTFVGCVVHVFISFHLFLYFSSQYFFHFALHIVFTFVVIDSSSIFLWQSRNGCVNAHTHTHIANISICCEAMACVDTSNVSPNTEFSAWWRYERTEQWITLSFMRLMIQRKFSLYLPLFRHRLQRHCDEMRIEKKTTETIFFSLSTLRNWRILSCRVV